MITDANKWEEDIEFRPQAIWLEIEEELKKDRPSLPIFAKSQWTDHISLGQISRISSITFLDAVDGKHQCRPATPEELQAYKDKTAP